MTQDNDRTINSLRNSDTAFVVNALGRGATRREIMGLPVAAGMSSTVASALIASVQPALTQTPNKGGRVRVAGAATSTTDTLDRAKGSNHTDYSRHTMFYNGLTMLDERLAPVLDLAESIDHLKTTLWTIKLRKDVRFHDGTP
jgi:peptide/nickel transport system substrate-binding protein